MRYLFERLCKYCDILKEDGAYYAEVLAKLDDIAVIQEGGRKIIGLSSEEKLNESHRHFSHLMCLYPLHLINYDTQEHKRIYDGSLFEIERLGSGMWVGFSFAMCAQIYAMAEKGNSAYEKLYQFAWNFILEI